MAGLRELVQAITTHCPHCNRPLELQEFASLMFQRILERVARGERVFVSGFGTFTTTHRKARRIHTLGTWHDVAERSTLRFRPAKHSRDAVRDAHLHQEENDDQDKQPAKRRKRPVVRRG